MLHDRHRIDVRRTLRGLTLVLGLAALGTLPMSGQETQEEASPETEQSRQELMQEFNELRQELTQIRQQAMEDPELQRMRDSLNRSIAVAAEEVEPGSKEKLERLEEIQTEIQAAREEGDQEEMQSLIQELQTLREEVAAATRQVLSREEIRAQYRAFEEATLARMEEIDPRTTELVSRVEEIQARLQGGAPGTSPGR